jgi:hypothetical protein
LEHTGNIASPQATEEDAGTSLIALAREWLSISSLLDSDGWDATDLAEALCPEKSFELVSADDSLPETLAQPVLTRYRPKTDVKTAISEHIEAFSGAKTFGSLIMPSTSLQANCRSFTPAQPNQSAASVRDYCSGFYIGCGCFPASSLNRPPHQV